MCLNPIEIVNPTRYVSASRFADRLLLSVPCGQCCECKAKDALQWSYRINAEFVDILDNGGYVYYDTLTYKHPPKISDVFDIAPEHDHFCFDYTHVQKFLKRLRKQIPGSASALRYIIVSEYGTANGHTHRPHYHVLFFVRDNLISPLDLSVAVAGAWSHGRTDGIPFRSPTYVKQHNVLYGRESTGRVIAYISKYIQKSSLFKSVIDARIAELYDSQRVISLPDTHRTNKLIRRRIIRCIGQHHRQSLGFGLSALRDVDMIDLMRTGTLKYQPYGELPLNVQLPAYYKRHLCQRQIVVDGKRVWTYTDDGIKLANRLNELALSRTIDELNSLSLTGGYHWHQSDIVELSDYVVNKRGRLMHGDTSIVSLDTRLQSDVVYKYSSDLDASVYGSRFVSPDNLGNDVLGYQLPQNVVSLKDYIRDHVFKDSRLEPMFKDYLALRKLHTAHRQVYADWSERYKQRLQLLC